MKIWLLAVPCLTSLESDVTHSLCTTYVPVNANLKSVSLDFLYVHDTLVINFDSLLLFIYSFVN